MLADAERLHHTVDQVLKAGVVRERPKAVARGPVDMARARRTSAWTSRIVRHHLQPGAIELEAPRRSRRWSSAATPRSCAPSSPTCSTTP